MLSYKDRDDPLPKIGEDYKGDYDAWYSFLINEWIPRQKDSDELMALFIQNNFDPKPFLEHICIERKWNQ